MRSDLFELRRELMEAWSGYLSQQERTRKHRHGLTCHVLERKVRLETHTILTDFGLLRTSLWRRVCAGEFPAPGRLGGHASERRDVRRDEAMGHTGPSGSTGGGAAVRWTLGGTNTSAMRRHSRLRGTCRRWTARSVIGSGAAWAGGPGNKSPKNGGRSSRRDAAWPAERAAGRRRSEAERAERDWRILDLEVMLLWRRPPWSWACCFAPLHRCATALIYEQ